MAFLLSELSPFNFSHGPLDSIRRYLGDLDASSAVAAQKIVYVGHSRHVSNSEVSCGGLLTSHEEHGGGTEPAKTYNAFQPFDKIRQSGYGLVGNPDFDGIMGDHVQSATGLKKSDFSGCHAKPNPDEELLHVGSVGVTLDRISLVRALGSCTRGGSLDLGRNCHSLIIKAGLNHDKFVATSLLDMYAKCGDLESTCEVFDRMPDLDVVSWNSLITGFSSNGFLDQALDLFPRLLSAGLRPNHYTFSIIFGVCGDLLAIEGGKQIHAYAIKSQFVFETAVGNALLTMYGKCEMAEDAEVLFKNLPSRNFISWTAMITSFYQNKCFEEALRQFYQMRRYIEEPNEYAFVIALASCSSLKSLNIGKTIHAHVIKNGYVSGVFIGSAVVDMYSGCDEMSDAEKQVEDMRAVKTETSWNALLAGYVRNDKSADAMEALDRMSKTRMSSNHFTYSIVLKACSSIPSLASGQQIHAQILKTNYVSNVHVGSSLIEMYGKCGCLMEAEQVFNRMQMKDTISWNSMLKAYSQNGSAKKTILLFSQMTKEGMRPTGATFLAILSACSHSGLIREGRKLFDSMVGDFGIEPEETHHACIVDLLSRGGLLEEARDFIERLPTEHTISIWRPLLAACRCYGNLQMAEFVAGRILEMDPNDPTVYITLSNMYAENGRWNDVVKQRLLMADRELEKEPGSSWIEVNNKVHRFFSGDETHQKTAEIYDKLDDDELAQKIRDIGYVPGTYKSSG